MLDFDDKVGPAIAIVCVAFVALLVWAAIDDSKNWDAFKETHHCKQVAELKGDVFNTLGVDSKGGLTVGLGSTPDKKGWLCDDGKTYFR